jgi:hypothetical protein
MRNPVPHDHVPLTQHELYARIAAKVSEPSLLNKVKSAGSHGHGPQATEVVFCAQLVQLSFSVNPKPKCSNLGPGSRFALLVICNVLADASLPRESPLVAVYFKNIGTRFHLLLLPLFRALTRDFLSRLENAKLKLNEFYDELLIFDERHVQERKIPNCGRAFNRSAFAARVVTREQAVRLIDKVLREDAKLPIAVWPQALRFTDADFKELKAPLCTLPAQYVETRIRGNGAARPAVIVDPEPAAAGDAPAEPAPAALALPADVPRASGSRSHSVGARGAGVGPASSASSDPVARGSGPVRRASRSKSAASKPKRLGNVKNLVQSDGFNVRDCPEMKTDLSATPRYERASCFVLQSLLTSRLPYAAEPKKANASIATIT